MARMIQRSLLPPWPRDVMHQQRLGPQRMALRCPVSHLESGYRYLIPCSQRDVTRFVLRVQTSDGGRRDLLLFSELVQASEFDSHTHKIHDERATSYLTLKGALYVAPLEEGMLSCSTASGSAD